MRRALGVIAFLGRRLPLRSGQRIGAALGSVAWLFAVRDRRKAMENMAVAFPEWTAQRRRRVTRAMFRHLGTSLFEIMWLPNIDETNAHTTFDGLERVTDAIRAGRCVVAFTGHCGNWEWLAYSVAKRGVPVTVLQRERREEGVNALITGIRAHAGVHTIDRGSTATGRELIRVMRKPGAVAFLIDQSIRTESANVPFFGRPALTPIGPATLAIRAGAIALAVFAERRADGTHHLRFEEPIETKRDDDPVELTARMTRAIEEQIRRVPEQWVWMHDRWRDRPEWNVTSTA